MVVIIAEVGTTMIGTVKIDNKNIKKYNNNKKKR